MRIAPGTRNSQNLELGTLQGEPHCEGVINVATDVGVDDDFVGCICARHRHVGLANPRGSQQTKNDKHFRTCSHASSWGPAPCRRKRLRNPARLHYQNLMSLTHEMSAELAHEMSAFCGPLG